MRKLFAVLLLLIIGQSAYAEYVTILPVNSKAMAGASSEIVTLSELYGKTTTIRYMTEDKSPAGIALNNTNIYPSDSLTLTEDVIMENQLFGFYIGAARQVSESQESDSDTQVAILARSLSFTDSEADYQALLDKAKAEAGSNIALAKIIEEQINRSSDSELLSLDTDSDADALLADDKTTTLIDTLLSGSSQSNDLDIPISGDNILISGLGGAILSGGAGGGSGAGGNGGLVFADGSASVPEPSTWVLLLLGVAGLALYRKRIVQ